MYIFSSVAEPEKFEKKKILIAPLSEIANFSTKYFILSKVYIDEGGIKHLYHGLSACTEDNPLAKARGLSPRTGGQTIV